MGQLAEGSSTKDLDGANGSGKTVAGIGNPDLEGITIRLILGVLKIQTKQVGQPRKVTP